MLRRSWLLVLLTVPVPLQGQAPALAMPAQDIGEEHYGDPPPVRDDASWLGLFAEPDSSWLQRVEVRWDHSVREGWGRHTYVVEPETPVLLLVGLPQLRPGPAETVLRWTESMYFGGQSVDVVLGSMEYSIAVPGEDPGTCDAVVTLSHGARSQVLFRAEDEQLLSCDEPHFDVHWAGDLDGDGRLDLLATFSVKYSDHPRRLYLSSAADEGSLVGQVSLFER